MLYMLRCNYNDVFEITEIEVSKETEKCFITESSRILKRDLLTVMSTSKRVYFKEGDLEKAKKVMIDYYRSENIKLKRKYQMNQDMIYNLELL